MTNRTSPTGAVAFGAITAFSTIICAATALAGPASFDGRQLPLEAIGGISVPGPNYDRLWAEDDLTDIKGGPMRVAVPNDVSVTPLTHGTWETMPNGRKLWRVIVNSPGSKHLNVAFEDWHLPPSGEAWIASSDGRYILNPITPAENIHDGEFWSAIVFSDTVIIEISVDEDERDELIENTTLTKINSGYRGFGVDETRGSSESCNIDVECPLGDEWQEEIPAIALYTINGALTCSGSMINNTANDETPYFFTADHCGISTGNDQSVVVYWNHENSFCREGSASGNNGNGNFNQYTTGSTYLAGNSNTDFTLIRLNADPNPSYGVTYAGWSRSSSSPGLGVSIHHPNSAEKRISSVQNVYATGPYWGVNWDEGRTYFGSSGSPLFNSNHQIVGSLCCGNSFCTNDDDDYYGRSMSSSWGQMSTYLDPNGTGAISVNTFNPNGTGGVCCLQGGCYNVPESTCNNSGGVWQPDVNCSEVDCTDITPGACCFTDGSCQNYTSNQCSTAGGSWEGAGTSCSSFNCPQPEPTGACCISSLTCNDDYTSTECSAAGGDYQGDNTDCGFVNCDSSGGNVEFHHVIVGTNLLSVSQDNWTVDIYAAVGEGNRVDAVAGNSIQEKLLTSTDGFYQDPNGGPTSVGINPNFYSFVPDLEWDSRVTIGALDQTGNPFDANNLGDVGVNWTTFENGGTLAVDNGTWYVLPTDSQGEAVPFISQDCSSQYGVLIARLTAFELDSEISIDALIQGRDALENTFQEAVSHSFTYEAAEDCNSNGVSDTCDIANGTSQDSDGNGVPDECDGGCAGDVDGDNDVDVDDILIALGNYGGSGQGDVDNDGDIDVNDLLQILADYGGC
ncbi:MAG: hypothetical protein CMJ29_02670 [Phycisphaerae bacterium]|nr:hypothetical protein [Phycisphaerae bacterium]